MVSRGFEKLVNYRIVYPVGKSGLFCDFQYGSRSSRTIADLLTVLSDFFPIYILIAHIFKHKNIIRHIYGTKYSIFLKAVFHKFYFVHS